MNAVANRIARNITSDIGARPEQVVATVALLDGGDTVPIVARYRKEVTGGLDDVQLRQLAESLVYLRLGSVATEPSVCLIVLGKWYTDQAN